MKNTVLIVLYTILCWLLLIALFAGVANIASMEEANAQKYSAGIPFEWRVVDGDTISTTSRPRKYYRFIGYDSPEITRPKCDAELLQGTRAKDYLNNLLLSPNLVWLDSGQLDRYGRSLVHLWVNGKALTTLMISAGFGVSSYGKARPNWCAYLKRKGS